MFSMLLKNFKANQKMLKLSYTKRYIIFIYNLYHCIGFLFDFERWTYYFHKGHNSNLIFRKLDIILVYTFHKNKNEYTF